MRVKRDLLGIKGMGKDFVLEVMERAKEMKPLILDADKRNNLLSGKSIVTLFYENSTRTRMSFEMASKYLGASCSNMGVSTSSVSKGETLVDTGATLDQMDIDVIIMRHSMAGAPYLLSRYVNASVINAGDGMNEHPTQALLDLFTIVEARGDVSGMRIAIVGDVLHSRVARSNAYLLKTMGADVIFAAPTTLLPIGLESLGVEVTHDVKEAVTDADVIMGLRMQKERQKSGLFPSLKEYIELFGVDMKMLRRAKPDALLLHPGPVNRGVELSAEVCDSIQSLIRTQVKNGVAVRMALLAILTGR